MKGLMKWPLIIAAILVVLRVALERAGAPDSVNNIVSVAVFYVLVAPLYFALRIAGANVERPYRMLLKTTVLFTAVARAMVIPTYWLAYIYQWPQARFSVSDNGVVGPGVTPFQAFVVIPVLAALVWILMSLVVGGGLGSIVIAMKRRSMTKMPEIVAILLPALVLIAPSLHVG